MLYSVTSLLLPAQSMNTTHSKLAMVVFLFDAFDDIIMPEVAVQECFSKKMYNIWIVHHIKQLFLIMFGTDYSMHVYIYKWEYVCMYVYIYHLISVCMYLLVFMCVWFVY